MIGWLRGEVVDRSVDGELLLDVAGVGYRVTVLPITLSSAGRGDGPLSLYVHTHVREDAIVLYGFLSLDERRVFEALLGAHGVGPALAMSVLAALSPDELVRAVLEEDLDLLCAVPGVGRKTAARLVLDLRSRLSVPQLADHPVPGSDGGASGSRQEVRAALAELGYGSEEIRRAMAEVPDDGAVEDLLRSALRELAGAR